MAILHEFFGGDHTNLSNLQFPRLSMKLQHNFEYDKPYICTSLIRVETYTSVLPRPMLCPLFALGSNIYKTRPIFWSRSDLGVWVLFAPQTRPERVGYEVSFGTWQPQRQYNLIWSSSYAKYAEKFCSHGIFDVVLATLASSPLCVYGSLRQWCKCFLVAFYVDQCPFRIKRLYDTCYPNHTSFVIPVPALSLMAA